MQCKRGRPSRLLRISRTNSLKSNLRHRLLSRTILLSLKQRIKLSMCKEEAEKLAKEDAAIRAESKEIKDKLVCTLVVMDR